MGLVRASFAKLDQAELDAGFVTIIDKRVFKGALRRKDDKTLIWMCDHVHSRPEYDARHPEDQRVVWEHSALKCGKEALYQWDFRQPRANVDGTIGMVGDLGGLLNLSRADTKIAKVGLHTYRGRIDLQTTGQRRLEIYEHDSSSPAHYDSWEYTGYIDADHPLTGSQWPSPYVHQLPYWLTGAGLLLGSVWGLTFQNPSKAIEEKEPRQDLIQRLTPKPRPRKRTSGKMQPHIRRAQGGGFEVIDKKGKVVKTVPHRGRAMKELNRLEDSA